jgi:hypothetical protein
LRFCDLETDAASLLAKDTKSSLSDWYRSVRQIEIDDLPIGDVCRAVRQKLFLRAVLPVAVARLRANVLAGDTYDGQLLFALSGLDQAHWELAPSVLGEVRSVLAASNSDWAADEELESVGRKVLSMLQGGATPSVGFADISSTPARRGGRAVARRPRRAFPLTDT